MLTSRSPLLLPPGNTHDKRSVLAKRARYYIPSLAWIPQYSWSLCVRPDLLPGATSTDTLVRLGGDFLAGLTIACILIPQSISYASSLAKLSPVTGLVRRSSFPADLLTNVSGE